MAGEAGAGGGFFSGGGMDFFKSKEGQQGLFAGLAGLGGGQKKEAPVPLPIAAMLSGYDPAILATYAQQAKEAPEASPAGNIIQAMGPEIFSKIFSGKEGKGEGKSEKVFSKVASAKQSPSISAPPSKTTMPGNLYGQNAGYVGETKLGPQSTQYASDIKLPYYRYRGQD